MKLGLFIILHYGFFARNAKFPISLVPVKFNKKRTFCAYSRTLCRLHLQMKAYEKSVKTTIVRASAYEE